MWLVRRSSDDKFGSGERVVGWRVALPLERDGSKDAIGRLVARRNASGAVVEELQYDGTQAVSAWDGKQVLRWA
jgi:hypothetical protein